MEGSPWYETFFDETYLRAYSPYLSTTEIGEQVDFLIDHLELEPGMRVLDLCCGQGRHAVPLAQRGLRVIGQDLSEHLLGKAREAAEEAGAEVELVRRDMREIGWTGELDAAINMFTSFGYLEDDRENFRVLEGVFRALKPGGGFCLDHISLPWLIRNWEPRTWSSGSGGLLYLQDRTIDWRRSTLEWSHIFLEPDGRRRAAKTRVRLFPPHEIIEWLGRAGFGSVELFGDFRGSPVGYQNQRLIALARKR